MTVFVNWITSGTSDPFYVRKTFKTEKPLRKATAKVCGLGQFIFHANGKKVGDHELDPGWTDYRKWIEYVNFDITDYLHEGINAIGAEIGNGWFIKNDEHYTFSLPAFMPPNPNPYRPFGKTLVFAMELKLEYTDGTQQMINADESFRTARHPVIQSNVYGSETIDGRLRQPRWDTPDFDDSSWAQARIVEEADVPSGQLTEQFQPPVKVIRCYDGHFLKEVNGREIYDFGQNMSGILSLKLRGHRGDVVKIYPAEKLGPDGDVDQVAKNWVTVDSVITCILGSDNEWEDFRMKFTYFAGKAVAVEKSSPVTDLCDLRAEAISSAWENSGSFTCDDERFNQIYAMIERTVEANMVSVHTDCPTIERFAWQEPNHLMAPSIMFMKNGKKLWEKFLKDMRAGQHNSEDIFYDYSGSEFHPGDGLMPSQAPCYIPNVLPVPGMGSFYDIIPWGSTCILGTYWHYRFYGDRKIIEDNYEAGKRYLNYLKTRLTPEGFICHGLGDWGNPDQALARENIETAFLYADAVTLAEFAHILEIPADEENFLKFAEEIKNNYNDRLLVRGDDGKWFYRNYENKEAFTATQACEALPLYWNMVPEDKVDDVVFCFRRTLEEKGAFASGEVGLPYIIQTASRFGMNEMIAQFITRPEHPSYYAFVKDGMTTLGEYWETNPRSHCHDMMGHIIEWYYTGIAGIRPLEAGFSCVSIKPFMPQSINHFTCTYRTSYGIISVKGIRKDGIPEYEIRVPEGILLAAEE